MKIETMVMMMLIYACLNLQVQIKTKNKVSSKSKAHLHNRNKNLLRLRHRQDPPKAAIDGPNDAVDNSKKIIDAQKVDPVLSKAASGLFPFYPRSFNVSGENEPVIMFT